jgi:hypothetical protein
MEAWQWSSLIPVLIPGMKVSPMFFAWQNKKSCVITDHARSHVNDSIPASEGKVKYDRHSFGGTLHYAWLISKIILELLTLTITIDVNIQKCSTLYQLHWSGLGGCGFDVGRVWNGRGCIKWKKYEGKH